MSETDAHKPTLRETGFWLSELLLLIWSADIYFADRTWANFGWGLSLVVLVCYRAEKYGLEKTVDTISEAARKASEEEDEDKPDLTLQERQQLMATAAMEMSEVMRPITESAEGHRKVLIDNGWSDSAAEHMAASYYQAMVKSFVQSQGK